MIIKSISICCTALTILSCAANYIEPDNDPNESTLVIPVKDEIDGTVRIGVADSNGCAPLYKYIEPRTKSDKEVEIKIPTNKHILVSLKDRTDIMDCRVNVFFFAKPNSRYSIYKKSLSALICQIIVGEEINNKIFPVPLLETRNFGNKKCLEGG